MASKENNPVSAVDNSDEDVFVKSEKDVHFEDVFACTKSLLEATKFDDASRCSQPFVTDGNLVLYIPYVEN